jgi:hypothetical protein
MAKKRKKSIGASSGKGWASFRIRGIKTSLFNLATHVELSLDARQELEKAYDHIEKVVKILDKEKGEA